MQQTNIPRVLNVDTNKVVHLSDLWKERKCIVCFLRHFNCRFCQQQISDLNRIYQYINDHHNNNLNDEKNDENQKISIIAIGVYATSEEAKQFKLKNKYLGELYVDYLSSMNAIQGLVESEKSGNFEHDTTAPSYDIFRLYDNKSNVFGADGISFRSEVAEKGQIALNKGFTDGDISNKPKQLFLRIGGVFVLGAGNTCDYAYRSNYAGDHPSINDVIKAAIGGMPDDNNLNETYIYPSTAEWAKDLKVTTKTEATQPSDTMDTKTDAQNDDAKYLESIRKDQEKRFDINRYDSNYKYLYCIAFIICIISLYIGYSDDSNKYIMFSFGLILFAVLIIYVIAKNLSFIRKSSVCPVANIKLLTLADIDQIATSMGDIKCDCGFVQTQDVSNKSENIKDVENRLRSMSISQEKDNNDTSPKELQSLLKTCCYLREFLAKSHPLVGRKGPVCPFVPGSLKMNAMYLSVLAANTFIEVENIARSFVDRFHSLEPKTGRKAAYKAVVLVFPHIPLNKAHDIIDKVQLKLKPEFVAKGLMIGEFHRNNNSCGLRNPNFYPLRTPMPSLAIRCIVPTDLVFLSPSKYEPSLRVKFLKSYLNQFVDDKTRSAKEAVKSAKELLKKAEDEMAQ